MRHIDDGFSYEFYEFEQSVVDYYCKKSAFDAEECERKYNDSKVGLMDDFNSMTFSSSTF